MTIVVRYDENLGRFFELFGEKYYVERSGALYAYIKGWGRWIKKTLLLMNGSDYYCYGFPKDGRRNARYIEPRRIINHFFLGFPEKELYKYKYDD
jgi:hypothetical protein